jgi:hypothetical protein
VGECVTEDLERDITIEPGVVGPINLPHPAFAKLRDDVVWAKARAGSKGQSVVVEYTCRPLRKGGLISINA